MRRLRTKGNFLQHVRHENGPLGTDQNEDSPCISSGWRGRTAITVDFIAEFALETLLRALEIIEEPESCVSLQASVSRSPNIRLPINNKP
jgi:hypothetical protein